MTDALRQNAEDTGVKPTTTPMDTIGAMRLAAPTTAGGSRDPAMANDEGGSRDKKGTRILYPRGETMTPGGPCGH